MGWTLFVIAFICWHIGLYGMFKKAGMDGWKALLPLYNTWCIVEKIGLKKYWFFLQLIPVVGQFVTLWIAIKFVENFGRFSLSAHAATVLLPFIYFPYLGFSKNEKYAGYALVKNYKKSATREWIDAAAFAVVAATIIRTFVFEAYAIPTSSMEKTLLINDYLFVSKSTYGPRIPNTPLAMPFVHHTIPGIQTKSYLEWIHIPYTRWFPTPVKRNDVVVFNFPAGDTLTKEYDSKIPYYDLVSAMGRDKVWQQFTVTTRPVDKRENYVKRCVGVAGDFVKVTDGNLFINGKPSEFTNATTFYKVKTKIFLDEDFLRSKGMHLTMTEEQAQSNDFNFGARPHEYILNLSEAELVILNTIPGIDEITKVADENSKTYPYCYTGISNKWTTDNFGGAGLWVPKKGATILLTAYNINLYKRVIQVYENNDWEERDGKVFLNGKEAGSYTFKMDYYWMMGDNRHKSQDSRFWGFVPEDHVVGKVSLVWFSWEAGPRWQRMFKWVH